MNQQNKERKIGIIGGKGMLGTDLRILAEKENIPTIIYDLPEFDITDASDLKKAVAESDIIVNCAAYTEVDKAESNPDITEKVNAAAVANLAKAVKSAGKYIIHISTDFVFGDNGNLPLSETSETEPLSVYGATKLRGEKFLRDSGCRYGIIRIEWTYGTNGENFITKIIKLAKTNKRLKVVDDQIGSPTPTTEVAKAVLCFLKNRHEGVFHFSARGYASRYEVAQFIIDELGIDTAIEPCSSLDFSTPAKRPDNSRFNCSKIDKILDFKRCTWQRSLADFLAGL